MTLRVGVIGTGMIGQDHIRRLTQVVTGSAVVAVSDVDLERAREVAESVAARAETSGLELIEAADVDAVLVTSWGPTHEEYVLAAIAAGKPVFCEKPLATTTEACARIMAAEVAHGRRLVQVGYMRRYDPAYRGLKEVVDSGSIGSPLLVHSRHRNASVPPHYTREMSITDTAVHDFDIVRWLLGEEFVSVQVLTARKSRHGGHLEDPLMIMLETESGVLVDVETSANIRYGYDIGGEVVGEDGTVALGDATAVVLRREGVVSGRVPADWRERFERAYDIELQEWVDVLASGAGAGGPSSWDGYAAAVVSDAAVESLHSRTRVAVSMPEVPELYVKPVDGSARP